MRSGRPRAHLRRNRCSDHASGPAPSHASRAVSDVWVVVGRGSPLEMRGVADPAISGFVARRNRELVWARSFPKLLAIRYAMEFFQRLCRERKHLRVKTD